MQNYTRSKGTGIWRFIKAQKQPDQKTPEHTLPTKLDWPNKDANE